jgi:hypothetical protein
LRLFSCAALSGLATGASESIAISPSIIRTRFKPDSTNPRGKKISVRLRHPNGCDLTEKTAKERLLAHKYLCLWEIFEDVVS